MSAMETETATENPPSFCVRLRRKCPCSNFQLGAGYFITFCALVLFACLIYAQEKVLALILLFFVLGVTLSICFRLIYLSRRRGATPYRQVPALWTGDDANEPLDPNFPLDEMVDVETGGQTPGATTAVSRDEMIGMQLQLLEIQQVQHARRAGRPFGRRQRDRQRGLTRLGFVPPGTSTHLQVAMLDRELGPNDYEMLLKLDDEVARAQAARVPVGGALPGGLSLDQINLFPSFIMPAPDISKEEHKEFEPVVKKPSPLLSASLAENCAVCLEPKIPGEVLRTVPCLHSFHVQCIDPWLQLKRTCPVCKMDFTQLQQQQ